MDVYQAALLDSFVVLTCALLLWKHARLSVLHPGFVYLVFHTLVFTFRIYAILTGAPTLFTNWRGALPVKEAEIVWAAILADIGLVVMTAAWLKVAADEQREQAIRARTVHPKPNSAMLSQRMITIVCALTFPIGLAALVYFGSTPVLGSHEVDLGAWNTSSWTMVTQSWTGLALLSLIYYYGFRKVFVFPMCVYLLLMAVQGFHRYRVVIPLIYLLLVWLSRKNSKWPPLWMVGAGFVVFLIFFPMKTIGRMVQNGERISDITEVAANTFTETAGGQSGDQVVMDEFASTVSLVDDSQRYYYGTLYYPLLTVAVPRQWWPDKPAVNQYMHELSNPSRPMALSGMVPTLHGESYANMGVLGIVIVGYISAYWLGRFYFAAMRKSYFSVYRFTYIMVACNLIQIFRDGLISLIMFTLVDMTPLVAIAVLSYLSFRRDHTWNSPTPSFLPGRRRGSALA